MKINLKKKDIAAIKQQNIVLYIDISLDETKPTHGVLYYKNRLKNIQKKEVYTKFTSS